MDDLAGELAPLAHGHKRGSETHRDDGPEEEAPRVETDNDVDLARRGLQHGVRGEPVHEMCDERLKRDGITQEGKDIQENNALGSVVSLRPR